MKLWNLSSFDELEPTVLQEAGPGDLNLLSRAPRKHHTSSVKLAMCVAAVSVATLNVFTVGSATSAFIPSPVIALADNTDQARPPLEAVFAKRFTGDWPQSHERDLLAEMVTRKGRVDPAADLISIVQSSQNESVDDAFPRLQEKNVSSVLRRKA